MVKALAAHSEDCWFNSPWLSQTMCSLLCTEISNRSRRPPFPSLMIMFCFVHFVLFFFFSLRFSPLFSFITPSDLVLLHPSCMRVCVWNSQRVCELIKWPVCEADLLSALYPPPPAPSKRELRLVELMRKRDSKSQVTAGLRR